MELAEQFRGGFQRHDERVGSTPRWSCGRTEGHGHCGALSTSKTTIFNLNHYRVPDDPEGFLHDKQANATASSIDYAVQKRAFVLDLESHSSSEPSGTTSPVLFVFLCVVLDVKAVAQGRRPRSCFGGGRVFGHHDSVSNIYAYGVHVMGLHVAFGRTRHVRR